MTGGSNDTEGTEKGNRKVEGITPNAILEKSVEETSKGNWSLNDKAGSYWERTSLP